MDITTIRGQFPALKEKTFLDAACVSLAPKAAVEAVQSFLDLALTCPNVSATEQHIAMDELREQARPEIARFLNAKEEEVALVESTTQGLNLAADAIPLEKGDRVLLCDLEFMQVAIPWVQKQKDPGIEIDVVPHREGKILMEDIAGRITPKTRVVAISSVQWSSGFRIDLKALGELCRERKVWLVVDAIQQLGAVPIDVRETPVDILTCGGHKWLNAPFGCGFLYINKGVRERLRAPLAGYLSLEPPSGGWGNYFQTPSITPVRDYKFVDEARRFEAGGTANYPGAIGLAASLRMINELGTGKIAGHILQLTGHLITGLETLGLKIVTPRDSSERAGIVTFDLDSAEKNLKLMEYLLAQKILVSVRYTSNVGGVRVSCHFFNSKEDLDKLLNAVEARLPKG